MGTGTQHGFAPRGTPPPNFDAFLRYKALQNQKIRKTYFQPSSLMAIHQTALRNKERDELIELRVKAREKKAKEKETAILKEKEETKKNKSYRAERGLPERKKE
tara:strand:- start:2853 stop:3164 length:312 start_codon:yes stop_codon:yes gene_type:complete